MVTYANMNSFDGLFSSGYGDSSNVNPSEEGLLIDSRTMWDWLTGGQ